MSYWSKYDKLRLLLQSQAQDFEFPMVCYTSKYRLKVLLTELKNASPICIHPVFWRKERVLTIFTPSHFGVPMLLLQLKGVRLLPFLQCDVQDRLHSGMLACLKFISFCKLKKIF